MDRGNLRVLVEAECAVEAFPGQDTPEDFLSSCTQGSSKGGTQRIGTLSSGILTACQKEMILKAQDIPRRDPRNLNAHILTRKYDIVSLIYQDDILPQILQDSAQKLNRTECQ